MQAAAAQVRRQGRKDGGDEHIIPSMSGPKRPRRASSLSEQFQITVLRSPEEGSEDASTASGMRFRDRWNRRGKAAGGGSDGIERAASSRTLPVQESSFGRLPTGVLIPVTTAAVLPNAESLEHACKTQTPKEASVCRKGGLGRSTRRFDRRAIETRGRSWA